MTLRDMYKKHHWQVSGTTFYRLLHSSTNATASSPNSSMHWRNAFEPSAEWQSTHDVAGTTRVARGAQGAREDAIIQLFRLLQAHELIIDERRRAAHADGADGDHGTNDLLVSDILRRNELPVWFISEQLAGPGWQRPRGCLLARQGSRLNKNRFLMLPPPSLA